MARTRNIKPGFFKNDLLAEIEPLGRLLFAGLWTIADREGRLEDRPKRIKAEVLPYDNCDIDALLTILFDKEFITRYEISAQKYIQITNFNKHQNPHVNEPASGIPAPEKYSTSTVQVPEKYDTSIRVAQFKSCLVPSTNHLKPSTDHLEYISSSADEGECIDAQKQPEQEKSKEVEPDPIPVPEPEQISIKPQLIADKFNAICISFPKVKTVSDKRKKQIHALLKKIRDETTSEDKSTELTVIETVFKKAEASDFLSGRSGKWNACGFDWLINYDNFLKVREGTHDNDRRNFSKNGVKDNADYFAGLQLGTQL